MSDKAKNNETELEFDADSELLSNLQSLKQHAGYVYIMGIVERWEIQANEDVMMKVAPGYEEESRGEWKAYRKVRKLLDQHIEDLRNPKPQNNFDDMDAYKEINESNDFETLQ